MTEAPARIRVAQDAEGFWTCREAVSGSPEYIRVDLHEKALTEAAEEYEHFVRTGIDSAPEPLRRLGEYLADLLDEDEWAHVDPMLLGAATSFTQALTEAERRGAEKMREAAAAVLDDMARGSAATLDMALFRSGAQAIRTLSFRALPLPAPPKESGS